MKYLFLVIFLAPSISMAYVDPGIVPMLFQMFYVVGAALFAMVFLKPWLYVKAFMLRLQGKSLPPVTPQEAEVATAAQTPTSERPLSK